MKLAKGIAGIAIFLVSALAYAGQFEYRIESVARNTVDTDCYEKLAHVAERFSAAAEVEIESTACITNRYNERRLDGVITYEASARVAITKLIQFGNYGIEESALFTSEEACRDALADQTTLFTSQTGLTPHIAYCFGEFSRDRERWTLQIEAVGQSEIEHFIMGVDLYGIPAHGYEAFWDEVSNNLAEKGITISKASLVSEAFYHRVTIGYYSTDRKQIYHNGDVRLNSPEACALVEARAAVAFDELTNTPIAVFCDEGRNGLWGTRLNIYTLESNSLEPAEFEHRVLPGFYENMDACYSSRPHQIEILEARGVEVIEAFCGEDARNRVIIHGFLRK